MGDLFCKITLALCGLLIIVGCITNNTDVSDDKCESDSKYDISHPKTTTRSYVDTLYLDGIDSLCVADTLPSVFEWDERFFVDFETKCEVVKRVYVSIRNGEKVIYVITGVNEPFVLEKRVQKVK